MKLPVKHCISPREAAIHLLKHGFKVERLRIRKRRAEEILKKQYGITNKHVNSLMWFAVKDVEQILRSPKKPGRVIDEIRLNIRRYVNRDGPKPEILIILKKLDRYKNCYVTSPNVDSFHDMMNGTLRTLLQHHFKSYKSSHGECLCGTQKDLQLSHEGIDRPYLFKKSVVESRVSKKSTKYDVYKSLIKFLFAHCEDGAVSVRCKHHHNTDQKTLLKIRGQKLRQQRISDGLKQAKKTSRRP